MKQKLCYGGYLLAAFLTHAYCDVHRYPAWAASRFTTHDAELPAFLRVWLAATFWPVYWLSRICFLIVENLPTLTWSCS